MGNDPLVVDKSFWKTKDKEWVRLRKESWLHVADILSIRKDKKALGIIKKYYLKGELPDWQKVNESWPHKDKTNRHLDLVTLLWLHPSQDYEVLKPLRDAYFQGFGRAPGDVLAGMLLLLELGIHMPCLNGAKYEEDSAVNGGYKVTYISLEGEEKLLFDLVYSDGVGLDFKFAEDSKPICSLAPSDVSLGYAGRWLVFDSITEHAKHMLLKYEEPIKLMCKNICSNPKIAAQFNSSDMEISIALYRIHHFDTAKEGDSPRTTFVTKMRKALDEEPFFPAFKALWEQIKKGEIEVEKPWEF